MREMPIVLTITAGSLLASCGWGPREVAEPSKITLGSALTEVSNDLHGLQDKYRDKEKLGLMVDNVTVQFQVAANASRTTGEPLSLATPLQAATINASVSNQDVISANRGNTITVVFKNVASNDLSRGIFSLKKPSGKPDTQPDKPGTTGSATVVLKPGVDNVVLQKACEIYGICIEFRFALPAAQQGKSVSPSPETAKPQSANRETKIETPIKLKPGVNDDDLQNACRQTGICVEDIRPKTQAY